MSLLCPTCQHSRSSESVRCAGCGRPLASAPPPLDVVLPDGTRVALLQTVTIGRAPGCRLRLSDPSVSRIHALILMARPDDVPLLADAGSSAGTWLDEQRLEGLAALRAGSAIRVGDTRLALELRREPGDAGATIAGSGRRPAPNVRRRVREWLLIGGSWDHTAVHLRGAPQ